ncbi:MAG: Trk family potassium uptake protein [Clostridiales bacterium]|nr:Trk family potassium uptake protein [Clostridiales bacterium]
MKKTENKPAKKHISSFRVIVIGFAAMIAAGTVLLTFPFAAKSGQVTPLSETVFTATSAVCVTGLVVEDTASYWSMFGQVVILILIQIGGLGVVTVASAISILSGKNISLKQRSTIKEAMGSPQIGGVVKFTAFVIKVTLAIELIGAVIMAPTFYKTYGAKGIWMAIFHTISAICNAGFDVMGTADAKYASMTSFAANPLIVITLICLIVVGGIGFLTWDDIKTHKWHIRKYRMQSKLIFTVTAILIAAPAAYFFFGEFTDGSTGSRLLLAIFQSVTTRTAGFNTADLGVLSGAGLAIFIVLMLIGGSPGSTAGGMKTTTVAVLFGNMISVFRNRESTHFFGRTVPDKIIKHALAILTMYVTLFVGGAVVISIAEGLPINYCLFETASAVGTVGLTLGITPTLGLVSRIVLIILMFCGRVGGLTIIYAAVSGTGKEYSKLPQEQIIVG